MKQVLIGRNDDGIVYAELNSESLQVRGFNVYDLVTSDRSADGNVYLNQCSWTHSESFEYQGRLIKFTSDMSLKGDQDLNLGLLDGDLDLIESAYKTEGCYCSKCGTFHDTEDHYTRSYVISQDGELYCKDCADVEDLLTVLNQPDDLFKDKDIENLDLEGFEEVETLFCDASGFGTTGERALTKGQAIERAELIIERNQNETLYCGLTGIGQFQVYVSIFKKVKSKKRK